MTAPRARGFTYLTVLFVVAILGGGLALAGELWHTSARRDKEAELLFVGDQYRLAIERYYLTGPQRQYPRALSDLLKDPRRPGAERYLRKLFSDPITGNDEWGIVRAPDGGILGVHSLSEEAPLKIANFRVKDAFLDGKSKYSDWKFTFAPAQPITGAAKPAAPQRQGQ